MAAATAMGARFHHVDVTDEGSAFDGQEGLAADAASKAGIAGMSPSGRAGSGVAGHPHHGHDPPA